MKLNKSFQGTPVPRSISERRVPLIGNGDRSMSTSTDTAHALERLEVAVSDAREEFDAVLEEIGNGTSLVDRLDRAQLRIRGPVELREAVHELMIDQHVTVESALTQLIKQYQQLAEHIKTGPMHPCVVRLTAIMDVILEKLRETNDRRTVREDRRTVVGEEASLHAIVDLGEFSVNGLTGETDKGASSAGPVARVFEVSAVRGLISGASEFHDNDLAQIDDGSGTLTLIESSTL